jgi:error-prone DNA polymerase
MLSALHYMLDLVREHKGEAIDLGDLDLEDGNIYAMLQRADAVGVFQVESRAQLATLPRLKPEKFYDLAIEVALIRPGPIQGGRCIPTSGGRTSARGGSMTTPCWPGRWTRRWACRCSRNR